jgi:putative zinc finger/helix-turn-helix YgiT family protein
MNGKNPIVTECPECGEHAVHFVMREQTFPFGEGEEQVSLTATVPVGHCEHCALEFTDGRAEVIRHEAVCAYLGIHSPREIIELRKQLNLSRAALADITRIGEASIARWERGAGIQNAALDQLLFLLSLNGNLNKLRARNARHIKEVIADVDLGAIDLNDRFKNIKNIPAKENEARGFRLRLVG